MQVQQRSFCQKNSLNFFEQHAKYAPILVMATFAEFKHLNITLFSLPSERSRLKHVSPSASGLSHPVSIQWKEVSAWRLVIRVAAHMLLYRSLFLGYFLHMNNILRAQKSQRKSFENDCFTRGKHSVLPSDLHGFHCGDNPQTCYNKKFGNVDTHIYALVTNVFDNLTHRFFQPFTPQELSRTPIYCLDPLFCQHLLSCLFSLS